MKITLRKYISLLNEVMVRESFTIQKEAETVKMAAQKLDILTRGKVKTVNIKNDDKNYMEKLAYYAELIYTPNENIKFELVPEYDWVNDNFRFYLVNAKHMDANFDKNDDNHLHYKVGSVDDLANYINNIHGLVNESVQPESHKQTSKKHKLTIKNSVDNIDCNKIALLKKFIVFCCNNLGIKNGCHVILTGERDNHYIKTTASFNPDNNDIWIYCKNRNMIGDVMRSMAHEIRHMKQNIDGELNPDSGNDGSDHENEANSYSGFAIRVFGKIYPEIYE